jgi:hypothetical protein
MKGSFRDSTQYEQRTFPSASKRTTTTHQPDSHCFCGPGRGRFLPLSAASS